MNRAVRLGPECGSMCSIEEATSQSGFDQKDLGRNAQKKLADARPWLGGLAIENLRTIENLAMPQV